MCSGLTGHELVQTAKYAWSLQRLHPLHYSQLLSLYGNKGLDSIKPLLAQLSLRFPGDLELPLRAVHTTQRRCTSSNVVQSHSLHGVMMSSNRDNVLQENTGPVLQMLLERALLVVGAQLSLTSLVCTLERHIWNIMLLSVSPIYCGGRGSNVADEPSIHSRSRVPGYGKLKQH